MPYDAAESRNGSDRRGHILIAGTGRAGTSFLVKYLDRLGLETDAGAAWHELADAGGETRPLASPSGRLPYVIKSPWTSEFVDQLLADESIALDVAIIPVRDLSESASSRVILERRAMYAAVPEVANYDKAWESWGATPGGLVYSLNPLDQGRILAVGFHHLVERLARADVPIVLPAFPRIVEDWAYLFQKLRPFLPSSVTPEIAEAAHRSVADTAKVRVGRELQDASDVAAGTVRYESDDKLDLIAAKRELLRLRKERDALEGLRDELTRLREEGGKLAVASGEIARLRAERDALMSVQRECARLRTMLEEISASPRGITAFSSLLRRRRLPPRTTDGGRSGGKARSARRRSVRPQSRIEGRGGKFYWDLLDERLGNATTEDFVRSPESSIIVDSSRRKYPDEVGRVRERLVAERSLDVPRFRIVVSNHALHDRAGSELWTYDVASYLSAAGIEVLVHSPILGPIAEMIRDDTSARVTSSVADVLAFEPQIVHVNHYRPAQDMVSAVEKTSAKIVNMCHGMLPRAGLPMPAGAHRYWAGSIMSKTKIWLLTRTPWKAIPIVSNFFDDGRYPQPAAGNRDRKALLFSRRVKPHHVTFLEAALARQGFRLETAGEPGRVSSSPEELLPGYDLVLAVGRSAIEALASGCRVVLWDHGIIGPAVTSANFWECVTANFALTSGLLPRCMLDEGATGPWLESQLAFSIDDGREPVLELTRAHLSLSNVGACIRSLYGDLLSDAGDARPRGAR